MMLDGTPHSKLKASDVGLTGAILTATRPDSAAIDRKVEPLQLRT